METQTKSQTADKYLIIGTGPCGLGAVRNFSKLGIPFDCVEAHSGVGGLWDIKNPNSTMYHSAHLISSKKVMEISEFPFEKKMAQYPHHSKMKQYFNEYVTKFDLKKYIQFNTKVLSTNRIEEGKWDVELEQNGVKETRRYKGLVIATGIFNHANRPTFKGQEKFKGEIIHSSQFKDPKIFQDKKVLIIGAGNSGCDIAVDAVYHAKKTHMSVRRGYYFVPKFLFGKPSDLVGGKIKLPKMIGNPVKKKILEMFTGDPVKLGFPKPDYKLFESHPIVNSLILYHLGHGDLDIMNDIERFDEKGVYFKSGEYEEYDLVLLATGYKLNYPFIDKKHLNWQGSCPQLFMNIFHPEYDDLFMLGMVEATGIGYQGRFDQAQVVAQYIALNEKGSSKVSRFKTEKTQNETDLRGNVNYIKLDRMSFYVHKETYLKKLKDTIRELRV